MDALRKHNLRMQSCLWSCSRRLIALSTQSFSRIIVDNFFFIAHHHKLKKKSCSFEFQQWIINGSAIDQIHLGQFMQHSKHGDEKLIPVVIINHFPRVYEKLLLLWQSLWNCEKLKFKFCLIWNRNILEKFLLSIKNEVWWGKPKIQAIIKHDTRHFIDTLNNKTTSQEKNGIYFYNITSQKKIKGK